MITAIFIARSLASSAGGGAIKIGGKMAGFAGSAIGGATLGGGAWAARNTIGRMADKAAKSTSLSEQTGALASLKRRAYKGIAGSSMDVRSSRGFQGLASIAGAGADAAGVPRVGLGQAGGQGGYRGIQEARDQANLQQLASEASTLSNDAVPTTHHDSSFTDENGVTRQRTYQEQFIHEQTGIARDGFLSNFRNLPVLGRMHAATELRRRTLGEMTRVGAVNTALDRQIAGFEMNVTPPGGTPGTGPRRSRQQQLGALASSQTDLTVATNALRAAGATPSIALRATLQAAQARVGAERDALAEFDRQIAAIRAQRIRMGDDRRGRVENVIRGFNPPRPNPTT